MINLYRNGNNKLIIDIQVTTVNLYLSEQTSLVIRLHLIVGMRRKTLVVDQPFVGCRPLKAAPSWNDNI